MRGVERWRTVFLQVSRRMGLSPQVAKMPLAEAGLQAGSPCITIRYAVFSQTDTCALLSPVNGAPLQSLQRSRKVIPASRAMRSSSDGQA